MTRTDTSRSKSPLSDQEYTPVVPSRGTLIPLSAHDVTLDGGFWGERQVVNANATLQHCLTWMEQLGWIGNFDRVAKGETGPPAGREFADSEIYKLLEALAWESTRSGGGWADEAFQALSARVVAAQQPDGYLNTRFGGPNQQPRYTDLEWGHELYCAGHLLQAAVARARDVPDDPLVAAAIRLADHICDVFGQDGRHSVCGHPEVELALVELARATGNPRYLHQATLFVQRRGRGTLDGGETPAEYFQDDVAVRDAKVLRGHAVRALYLSAGAVDVAVENGDDDLLNAVRDQWENTVAARTYLTGGMGSRHEGESFGDDFELPSDRAYSETCAGVASVMLSWRLLLAGGESKYADLIERTLFNVVATSPDSDGTSFFYVNPLQRNQAGIEAALDEPSPRASSSQRAPWFEVSCCPTNVARTLASLGGYIATKDIDGLQIHQYINGHIETLLPDGERIELTMETGYPFAGEVAVTFKSESTREWTLSLRVPSWARGRATVDDGSGARLIDGDVATVRRAFSAGTTVRLSLPIEPRFTYPDPRIDALRDCVAVERGPLVLCAESIDLPGGHHVRDLAVYSGGGFNSKGSDLTTVSGATGCGGAEGWPYASHTEDGVRLVGQLEVPLSPYFGWGERGPSEMRVWLPIARP